MEVRLSDIEVVLNPDVKPTGSDLAVVNAARRSFGKRSEWVYTADGTKRTLSEKDKNLLRFLARGMSTKDWGSFLNSCIQRGHNVMAGDMADWDLDALKELLWHWRNTPTHDTPFNHCFVSFEVKAPIFTRAQLVKHEYLIVSEYSRRYIIDDISFYKHSYRKASKDKKQGSGGLSEKSDFWQKHINKYWYRDALERYNLMLDDGIAPEQARGILPQDLMTAWTWSGTLGAFAKMCRERLSPDAQYESRIVAQHVYDKLRVYYPVSAPLLIEGSY